MVAAASENDRALSVIDKKLRTKDNIDSSFDVEAVEEEVEILDNSALEEDEIISTLSYDVDNNYFGFNVVSNLNLGRAYKLVNNEHGDDFKYNISPDAKRVRFSDSELNKINEKWIDHVFKTIASSRNSALVLENIFTRVTTGNYKEILPYIEQVRFVAKKIKQFDLQNKIVALSRGQVEKTIIKNGGPDLMKMLGDVLGIPEKVTGYRTVLIFNLKDPYKKDAKISITNFNPPGSTRAKMLENLDNYAQKVAPGFDIYWNTTAKFNGSFGALTTNPTNLNEKKSCTYICFGPMSEYDSFNYNRPLIGPYSLNRDWFKVGFEHRYNKEGQLVSQVSAYFNDYNAPHEHQIDDSNYVSSVIASSVSEALTGIANVVNESLEKTINKTEENARKGTNQFLKAIKKATKQNDATKQGKNPTSVSKISPTKKQQDPQQEV